ncbi:Piso0_002579 [Millerozyma farinosa CBS 7064]|uniref:Piso0_002579 protein n=1 Tax=Pichia sorbitophila (strain ATCC MYA-4447 / BCRC 22081 / CBS 7064 / NBRC 10061 / NRRL Y-12695) TaxID=559304 RepID=G8YFF1_PICSO|nr:Piso0_002579 [Millerozyma farinosa CBS 7064]
MQEVTFLSLIDKVDTFPYSSTDPYYQLLTHDKKACLGYVHPNVVEYFKDEKDLVTIHGEKKLILGSHLDTMEKRNTAFRTIANKLRSEPEFDEMDKGWRNELYTIHYPTHEPYMLVERAFSTYMGVITYGVHINGFVPPDKSSNGKLKMWIPRRSSTKPTYPNMLDNTVAGGLGYPHGIMETVIKECFEEAGLKEDFVKKHIKSSDVLSYIYLPHPHNVQPEVEYIFDIVFDDEDEVLPDPQDGEAQDFNLLEIDTIIEKLKNREFKPNCALVIINFLQRHGYITPESEPDYLEITHRSHRKLPFPTI